uniref:Aminotransferase class V domain-containing protein n=1 Tax=Noctiluca scintillans TaxID=2966 RepID=A0A7S1FCN3_NOCSC
MRAHAQRAIGRRSRVVRGFANEQRPPLLFTPGPTTTTASVKQSMMVDVGARDENGFLGVVRDVRGRLVSAAQASPHTHDCVLVQGAGTHAIESVLCSVVGPESRVLILSNGGYGERQKDICQIYDLNFASLDYPDHHPLSAEDLEQRLREDDGSTFTHVSMIHHETTAGVINPLSEICDVMLRFPHVELIVDSMSGFGAYEVDLGGRHSPCKYLVSSANKNLQGIPGFSYCIYERSALQKLAGRKPRSLTLDLYQQAQGLSFGGQQFRFTPPTHVILAFQQALTEWEEEGGWAGRGSRYKANYEAIKRGVERLGLGFVVDEPFRGHVVSTIRAPRHPKWDFSFLHRFLQDRGFVIFPGKLSRVDSFRLGHIGNIHPAQCDELICVLQEALTSMGVLCPMDRAE